MRRLTIVFFLCIFILSACGVNEPIQGNSPPSVESVSHAVYPTPDGGGVTATIVTNPTLIPPVPSMDTPTVTNPTLVPPVASMETPTLTPSPSATMSFASEPFITTTLERYPLDLPGTYVIAWSPDGAQILYAQGTSVTKNGVGYPRETLALFDVGTHQVQVLAEDAVSTDFHPQLRPVWDYAENRILYARMNTDAKPKTKDTSTIKATVDIIALDPSGVEHRIFDRNVPLYDASISYLGQVGIFKNRELKSLGINKKDKKATLPTALTDKLDQDPTVLYHRLWVAPDSMHYAVAMSNSLSIYQSDQETPLQIYNFSPPAVVHQLIWSPDSMAMYYRLWDPQPPFTFYGAYANRITDSTPYALALGITGGVAWSPDSRWLSVGRPAANQCAGTDEGCTDFHSIVDPFGVQAQTILTGFAGLAEQSAWSPDSTRIASVCYYQESTKSPEIGELCILNIEEKR